MQAYRVIVLTILMGISMAGPASAAVLKLATIAPEGSEWMLEHRAAAAKIKELTDGRVELKFYGGGVMGTDKKVLRKIRIGQLQGAAFSASGLAERYPDIVLYGLPWVFRTQDEVDFARARFDAELMAGLSDAGLVSFGFAGGGFAYFMSNEPLRNTDDLKGKKIWVPAGDENSFAALEMLNLSPVVLPLSDVLTGLQTGLLDVIVTPPSAALLLQWYTKVKYITPVPVAYTLGLLALDERAYKRLSVDDQAIVRTVFTETYQRLDEINRSDNLEAEEALLINGLKAVEANKDDIPYWREVADQANTQSWEEKAINQALYEQLKEALNQFRNGEAGPEPVVDSNE